MAQKKELTMEMRLLLAFLLMGLVLFVTPYFYKQPPSTAAKQGPAPAQTAANAGKTEAAAPEAAKPPAPTAPAAEIPGQIQGSEEQEFTIDTDLFQVRFSNRGAVVRSWVLKKYKDAAKKPVDLVNPRALAKVPAPFSLYFKGQPPIANLDQALFSVHRPDPLTVIFEYSDGHTGVKKSFKFAQNSYLVAVDSQVTQNGMQVPHSLGWRGGFGDSTVANPVSAQTAVYYDVNNSKLVVQPAKNAKDGPVSATGQYSFAGLQDSYFAGVFLPEGRSQVEITEFADTVANANNSDEQRVGAAVGGEGVNRFTFFPGPKDYDLLHEINPKLDTLIDWGWFEFLAKPLFLILKWTANRLTHNYGWAIVLVTIGINIVLFPLKITGMKSSKKMQAIQPLVNAINEKYKGIPARDPRQAEKNSEVMALYKKYGINPLGGCLPMLLQIPFFYAYYRVLSVSIEMRGASFLWIHDLAQPETGFFAGLGTPLRLLPLILILTQFLSQKMTPPTPGVDPAQQKMMMFMPLMMGFVFYGVSSGLVLYWLTSNLVGVAQQWLLNRQTPAPVVEVPKPSPKKKTGTKR
ncbi:MAG TPA: membrane protein insertase YidC [Bryobacteraceae bacterium]|nr:membrane protein insertase YidC [Bryobacteraceae bacterium]HYK60809.1 membrane protein insertase YidC [Bryobacteraceae bacterium]